VLKSRAGRRNWRLCLIPAQHGIRAISGQWKSGQWDSPSISGQLKSGESKSAQSKPG